MAKNKKIFLKAFTLIELLVVIAVIGLLSTIVIVNLGGTRAKARDAKRLQDLRQLQNAVELYYDTYGKYPKPCRGYGVWSGHCSDFGNCDTNYIMDENGNNALAPWLPTLPRDPKYDTGGQCYLYRSDGKDYMIIAHFTMETICDGTDADTIPDPGDECNPPHIQQMERVCCEQPTIAVYTPGAKEW